MVTIELCKVCLFQPEILVGLIEIAKQNIMKSKCHYIHVCIYYRTLKYVYFNLKYLWLKLKKKIAYWHANFHYMSFDIVIQWSIMHNTISLKLRVDPTSPDESCVFLCSGEFDFSWALANIVPLHFSRSFKHCFFVCFVLFVCFCFCFCFCF